MSHELSTIHNRFIHQLIDQSSAIKWPLIKQVTKVADTVQSFRTAERVKQCNLGPGNLEKDIKSRQEISWDVQGYPRLHMR